MKKWARILGILFVVLGVFAPVLATLVTFLLPETFASSTKILHPATSPTPIVAAVGMLTTRSNLDLVITDLNLAAEWGRKYKQPGDVSMEKCREILTRMIQIQMPRASFIVQIRVFSDNKGEAAVIANKLTEVYCRTSPGSAIVDQARPNPVPVRPNKKLNITIAALAGLSFLIVGISLLIASRIAPKEQPATA